MLWKDLNSYVLFADERRGIFRVEPGADFYTLSAAGKSTLRDSHRLGRKSDNRQASLSRIHAVEMNGERSRLGCCSARPRAEHRS